MLDKEKEIQACRQEIQALQYRINMLSARVDALAGESSQMRSQVTDRLPQLNGYNGNPAEWEPARRSKPIPTQAASERYRDLENTIGKNLFPILASLLILLGVGVFISSIYEYIPQIVKVAAIYVFGFSLLLGGLLCYQSRNNKFWLGISSCGLAELLVSIIASHTYFGILPLPAAFLLILVWIAGSLSLTKFNPTVFKSIAYVGFQISMLLGLSLLTERDTGLFLTLMTGYILLAVFFMLTNREQVTMNSILAIASIGGLLQFADLSAFLPDNADWLPGWLLFGLIAGLHAVYLLWAKLSQKHYPLFATISIIVLNVFLCQHPYPYTTPVLLGSILVMWFLASGMERSKLASHIYIAFAAFLIFFNPILGSDFDDWTIQGWYPIFLLLAYGLYWMTQSRQIAWLGFAAFLEFSIFAMDQTPGIHVLVILMAMTVLALLMTGAIKKDNYLQTAWYVWLFLLLHLLQDDAAVFIPRGPESRLLFQTWDAVFFTVLAVCNTAYQHITFTEDGFFAKLTPVRIILLLLQAYLFINCMDCVENDAWISVILGILSSLLIISYSLWHTYKTRGAHRELLLWQFIKFSLYCWQVLALLDSPGVIINIALLVIAIIAIAIGFRLNAKTVRVYGLVLSLLDVVSLVLVNVDISNSLQLAAGIALCGVLCFIISFLYSRFAKTAQNAESENI